jgi:hypothetical protein
MKNILTALTISLLFSANSNSIELEVAKCTKVESEYKFFALNSDNNCRDIRKFCEFNGVFYSLGKGPKIEEIQCIVPLSNLYDVTAKWVPSK